MYATAPQRPLRRGRSKRHALAVSLTACFAISVWAVTTYNILGASAPLRGDAIDSAHSRAGPAFSQPLVQSQQRSEQQPRASQARFNERQLSLEASGAASPPRADGSNGVLVGDVSALGRAVLALAAAICVAIAGLPINPNQPWFGMGPRPAVARGSYSSGSRVNRDPLSLLQTALPIEETLGENKVEVIRDLQKNVENIKANALLRLWDRSMGNQSEAMNIVNGKKDALFKPVDASRKIQAEGIVKELANTLPALRDKLEAGKNEEAGTEQEKDIAKAAQELALKCQNLVGQFEEIMVPPGYKAPIPKDVDLSLPQLQGRATVEMVIARDPNGSFARRQYDINAELAPEAKLKIICDGWSAPISAGNFVDLVNKGFYNNMTIQRSDGFIIQTGDSGPENGNGYRPGPGKTVRTVPLEVGIKGRQQALYGETIDEANLVGEDIRIPFQADGTISMARAESDNDSASSQIFLFLFESDMTPAGKNFLDGRYSTFGYTVEGDKYLREIKEGDIIKYAKVTDGVQNLKLAASEST